MVRIGVIGCSNLGRAHAKRLLAREDATLAAYCDLDEAARQQMQEQVCDPAEAQPAAYEDYETMFQEAGLDGVVVVLPHAMHYAVCRRALESGIHVLVEKPMVTSTEEARELARIAETENKVLDIAFQGAHSANFLHARQLIEAGEIGAPRFIVATLHQAWLALLERMPQKRWRLEEAQSGGGELYDSGSHLINSMIWITGLEPERVHAVLDRAEYEVDINSAVTIEFRGGAIASIAVCGAAKMPGMQSWMRITGESGEIVLPNGSHGGSPIELHGPDGERGAGEPPEGTTPADNLVDAIEGRAEPMCPSIWGVRLAALMESVYEAADRGRPATVSGWA